MAPKSLCGGSRPDLESAIVCDEWRKPGQGVYFQACYLISEQMCYFLVVFLGWFELIWDWVVSGNTNSGDRWVIINIGLNHRLKQSALWRSGESQRVSYPTHFVKIEFELYFFLEEKVSKKTEIFLDTVSRGGGWWPWRDRRRCGGHAYHQYSNVKSSETILQLNIINTVYFAT